MGGTVIYRANTSMRSMMRCHDACNPQPIDLVVAECHKSRRYSARKLKNGVLSITKKRDCIATAANCAIMRL